MVSQAVAAEAKIQSAGLEERKLAKVNEPLELAISVVICAKNAAGTIGQCLDSVRRNEPSEIVVVDGGSVDGTVQIARKYTDRIYDDKGNGLAYARHLGAEHASGSHVFYVDSDVILPEGCLQTMMDEMKTRGYCGIHAQVIGFKEESYWAWAEGQHFRARFNKEGEAKSIGTIACIYRRDTILKYGFDPFFVNAAEDADLCYRVRRNGLRLGKSSAFIYHQHRATLSSFIKQRVSYGRGNARFFWKHKAAIALMGPTLMIPFGILMCVRSRSLRIFPYYLVWSVAGTYGMLRELGTLMFGRLRSSMLRQPSAEYAKGRP
jgi:glycosyltransferase involved in cell wall biosynthesis